MCSECVQSVFRVCSECVQSVFRVCSECHQSVFRVCSECVQSVFRVCSECFQSVFRICSECVQSVFNIEVMSSSSASGVSIFGIFLTESHREWQNWTRYQRARASGAGGHPGARWDMRLAGRSKWLDSVPV